MYLTNLLMLNVGPVADLQITPQFNADGSPKPIVLVGANGSGKTNALSTIADALAEIATQHFQDVLPGDGVRHEFFRLVGGLTTRVGAPYELSALKFKHNDSLFYYRSKAGNVEPALLAERMIQFPSVAHWTPDEMGKSVQGPNNQIEPIFRTGAYVFFPADRSETPYWENNENTGENASAAFTKAFSNLLNKPIILRRTISNTNSWVVDLILDQAIDSSTVMQAQDLAALKTAIVPLAMQSVVLSYLNEIIRIILNQAGARVVRVGRRAGDRKIQVFGEGDQPVAYSLAALSAGQMSLLSMFSTILRYGDSGIFVNQTQQIEGIVLIDEADAHLHSDLQHDVLPKLMRLFPRVQFIVTSHAPLFPLGMQKLYGDDGFTLIDMPSGTRIDPERFSEFEKSFQYLSATSKFEDALRRQVSAQEKPLILCEGETDPRYLKAAAELLGFPRIANETEIDWVGTRSPNGAAGGGKDNLNDAHKFLKNNPSFLRRKTVLLYDCDANKPTENSDNLYVRTLPKNDANQKCPSGIENLLPTEVFGEEYYVKTQKMSGADLIERSSLKKSELCQHLCVTDRQAATFAKFLEPLAELDQLLFPAPVVPIAEHPAPGA